MLLVVVAIVLWLVAKNWTAVAPTAMEINNRNRKPHVGTDVVEPETYEPAAPANAGNPDAWNPSPPARPSLSGMEERTSQHSANVADALDQAN